MRCGSHARPPTEHNNAPVRSKRSRLSHEPDLSAAVKPATAGVYGKSTVSAAAQPVGATQDKKTKGVGHLMETMNVNDIKVKEAVKASDAGGSLTASIHRRLA